MGKGGELFLMGHHWLYMLFLFPFNASSQNNMVLNGGLFFQAFWE